MYLCRGSQVQGMKIYQQVYDMCNAKPQSYAEDLLQGISQLLVEHCIGIQKVIKGWIKFVQLVGYSGT